MAKQNESQAPRENAQNASEQAQTVTGRDKAVLVVLANVTHGGTPDAAMNAFYWDKLAQGIAPDLGMPVPTDEQAQAIRRRLLGMYGGANPDSAAEVSAWRARFFTSKEEAVKHATYIVSVIESELALFARAPGVATVTSGGRGRKSQKARGFISLD